MVVSECAIVDLVHFLVYIDFSECCMRFGLYGGLCGVGMHVSVLCIDFPLPAVPTTKPYSFR